MIFGERPYMSFWNQLLESPCTEKKLRFIWTFAWFVCTVRGSYNPSLLFTSYISPYISFYLVLQFLSYSLSSYAIHAS